MSTTQLNPTTRRHPRTMNEAFATGPQYACPIERCPNNPVGTGERALGVALACFIGYALAMVLVNWWVM